MSRLRSLRGLLLLLFFKDFIYLFVRDTERVGKTQAEGEAGSLQGTRSQISRMTPWAKGRQMLSP